MHLLKLGKILWKSMKLFPIKIDIWTTLDSSFKIKLFNFSSQGNNIL